MLKSHFVWQILCSILLSKVPMNEIFQGQLQSRALIFLFLFFSKMYLRKRKKVSLKITLLTICYIFYFEWLLCLYFKFNLLKLSSLIIAKRHANLLNLTSYLWWICTGKMKENKRRKPQLMDWTSSRRMGSDNVLNIFSLPPN